MANKSNHKWGVGRFPYNLEGDEYILKNGKVFRTLIFYVSGIPLCNSDINKEISKSLGKMYSLNNFTEQKGRLEEKSLIIDVSESFLASKGSPVYHQINYEKVLEYVFDILLKEKLNSEKISIFEIKKEFFLKDTNVKKILIEILEIFFINIQKLMYGQIQRDVNEINKDNYTKNGYKFLGYDDYLKTYWNEFSRIHEKNDLFIDSNKLNFEIAINLFFEFFIQDTCQKLIFKKINEYYPKENGKEIWDEECQYPVYEYPEREGVETLFSDLSKNISLYLIKDLKNPILGMLDFYINKKQKFNYSL